MERRRNLRGANPLDETILPEDEGQTPVRKPNYPISSVDNAIRLLLMLSRGDQLRLSEASESLSVVPSTAHRLLAMLQYHGLVEQDPKTKAYRAGPALLDLGLSVVAQMDIRQAARRHLEILSGELGETAHLLILRGREVLFLDSVESSRPLRTGSRAGMSLPAHCVSGGKAMLADLPVEELRQLYPSERLARLTPKTVTRRTDLERELDRVRQRGYATSLGESEADIGAIGASIRQPADRPQAAVAVSAPLARLAESDVERFGAAVVRAAAGVAAKVAGSAGDWDGSAPTARRARATQTAASSS